METLNDWKKAKATFETLTGQKKPKPKGFFAAAFNHSGLTAALKKVDATTDALATASTRGEGVPEAAKKATAAHKLLSTEIKNYVKVLEKEAKDEEADKNEKTKLVRALKSLKADLELIDSKVGSTINSTVIANQQALDVTEKTARMLAKSLKTACLSAAAAVKKVKADPTPETFNSLFCTNDPPGRKIGVQMRTAARELKAGRLPSLREDPAYLDELCAPWGTEGSPNNRVPDDASKELILNRIKEFSKLLKLAADYSNQLG